MLNDVYGGPEGTSLYNFSLHYINFDLCEKTKICDYVYIKFCLECIHNYLYMYT